MIHHAASRLKYLFALVAIVSVLSAHSQTIHPDVLSVGPWDNSPAYFYINTKIPFNDYSSPQIYISGYNYASGNKAVKLTLGWYIYNNNFHWSQYKSDLGYYNPPRIRLGTYNDAGITRIRIEIANDGFYWTSFFISANDRIGSAGNYTGWSAVEGEMPTGSTSNIITVPEQNGVVFKSNGNLGIGTSSPQAKLEVYNSNPGYVAKYNNAGGYAFNAYQVAGTDKAYIQWHINDAGSATGTSMIINNVEGKLHLYDNTATGISISGGMVGIGTTSPGEKLAVNGNVKAKKVIVTQSGWSDYVFNDDYKLRPLSELSQFIKDHKHLPEVPTVKEVEEKGISVGDNQALLLKKVEELTLYVIKLQEQLNQQNAEIAKLKANK